MLVKNSKAENVPSNKTAEPVQSLVEESVRAAASYPIQHTPFANVGTPWPSAATVTGHATIIQRIQATSLSQASALARQLQQSYGNRYVQRVVAQMCADVGAAPLPENKMGLPGPLKTGVEALSGMDMSDVQVHVNSAKPAQINALAYAQGKEIHLGPGQEKHLPHEAWHVVQQAQGRVQPTMQMKSEVSVNDNEGLEHEADVMGAKAVQMRHLAPATTQEITGIVSPLTHIHHKVPSVIQRAIGLELEVAVPVDQLAPNGLTAIRNAAGNNPHRVPNMAPFTASVQGGRKRVVPYSRDGIKASIDIQKKIRGATRLPDLRSCHEPFSEKLYLFIVVEGPANGASLSEVVDKQVQNMPGNASITRRMLTLGGETAEVVEGLPSRSGLRQIFALHADVVYRLSFEPVDPEFSQAAPDVATLWTTVTTSFHFMKP